MNNISFYFQCSRYLAFSKMTRLQMIYYSFVKPILKLINFKADIKICKLVSLCNALTA